MGAKRAVSHRYRMPAEWEPHEATWIAWPHNPRDWPGKFAPIPWVYAEIVRVLHHSERVHILVGDKDDEMKARAVLSRVAVDQTQLRFFRIPTNRVWMRDSGPIFVRDADGRLALTNWRFNAWAKYDDWQLDNRVPQGIARALGMPLVEPKAGRRAGQVVLEGGSIDANGAGVLLTTEECLLSEVQQRNPGLGREDLERIFCEYLGIRKTIWLKDGIAGDDTHGHVDDLARFVDQETIVIASERDRSDENHERLRENLRILRKATDWRGRAFRVVTLPMPRPVIFAGQRLPASYANFYIANGSVLVPTFNDPADREALNTLQRLFPTRRVTGIHAVDLVWGLGTLHCMTQQQPVADCG